MIEDSRLKIESTPISHVTPKSPKGDLCRLLKLRIVSPDPSVQNPSEIQFSVYFGKLPLPELLLTGILLNLQISLLSIKS